MRRPVPLYSLTAGELTSNYICANRERLEHDPNLRRPKSLRHLIASGEPLYVVTEPSRLEQLAQLSDGLLRTVEADARSVLLRR